MSPANFNLCGFEVGLDKPLFYIKKKKKKKKKIKYKIKKI